MIQYHLGEMVGTSLYKHNRCGKEHAAWWAFYRVTGLCLDTRSARVASTRAPRFMRYRYIM